MAKYVDLFTACGVTKPEYIHAFEKLEKRDKALRKYYTNILSAFLEQGDSVYRKVVSLPEFSGDERTVGAAVWLPPESSLYVILPSHEKDIPPESQGGLPRVIWMRLTEKSASGKLRDVVSDYVRFVWENSEDNCWILILAYVHSLVIINRDVLGSQPNKKIWKDILQYGCDAASSDDKTTWAFVTEPAVRELLQNFGFEVEAEGTLDDEITIFAMCKQPGPLEPKDDPELTVRLRSARTERSTSVKPMLQKVKSKKK